MSKGKVYHDYAKAVRLDKNRCGPKGKWFHELPAKELSPVEELFESFFDL